MTKFRGRSAILAILMLVTSASSRGSDIAVLYALDPDLAQLKGIHPVTRTVVVGSRRIQEFRLGANRVYALKMGSGPLETAISAQALMARLHCDIVISVGPAGALNSALHIGEWFVVGDVRAEEAEYKTWKLQPEVAIESLRKVSGLALPIWPIASGGYFVAQSSARQQLASSTKALAVEMNLAGLAPVCADHHTPLVALRIVSDEADEAAPDAFRRFVQNYKGEGGAYLAAMIEQMDSGPNDPRSYRNLRDLFANPAPED